MLFVSSSRAVSDKGPYKEIERVPATAAGTDSRPTDKASVAAIEPQKAYIFFIDVRMLGS
jgi:hypothetical protein